MARRHIVYLRCSTSKQETESQRTALTERVSHFTEPVEWIEDYYTGAKADRAGYQHMLNLVNGGQVIDITCWRCDRIGRNALENLKLAEACRSRSTDLVGHADGLRLLSPNGQLVFTILSAIAEYEREKISENTKAGMAVAKARGKIIGGSITGYTKQKMLDLIPEMKLLHEAKYSVNKIAKKLKVNRKSVTRIFKMLDGGTPLKSRAELLALVPVERRGKAYQKSLTMN